MALTPGLGPQRLAALLSQHGSPRTILDLPPRALAAVPGISLAGARRIRHALDAPAVTTVLAAAERTGQRVLVPSDPDFPPALRVIPDPPLLLFARGRLDLLAEPMVAIVGSRRPTRYGIEVASRLGVIAAQAGAVVVSGMALGLDAAAQGAALRAGGRSIGVLGTGVDVVYPPANAALHRTLSVDGALLSELPPGVAAHSGSFPRRNRLISGLARALVVVEAAEASGTLITVTCALEQGREVFAVPGPITSPTSRGTNRLIRDGARLLHDPDELPALLGLGPAGSARRSEPPCTLSPLEAQVWRVLTPEPMTLDTIALTTGIPVGPLLGALLALELGGLAVRSVAGYARCPWS